MKQSYTFLIYALMGIGLIYFAIRCYQLDSMQKQLLKIVDEYSFQLQALGSSDNNRMHEFTQNGKRIDADALVYTADNDSTELSAVLSPITLILRYSETDCDMCVKEQIRTLQTCRDSLQLFNIVFLASYENAIYMRRYLKSYSIDYKVFNLSNELMKQMPDIGAPYYFVLDKKEMRINNMFVPAKERPELTINYLKSVKNKYFELEETFANAS